MILLRLILGQGNETLLDDDVVAFFGIMELDEFLNQRSRCGIAVGEHEEGPRDRVDPRRDGLVRREDAVDPERPDRIIGVLDRAHIVSAYAEAYRRQKELVPRADAIQSLNEESEMVLEQAHVTAGSRLANVYVRDAGFPPESTLGAIRRARQTVVPHGSTCIQPGDQLIVLTTRENARNVRQWLEQMT